MNFYKKKFERFDFKLIPNFVSSNKNKSIKNVRIIKILEIVKNYFMSLIFDFDIKNLSVKFDVSIRNVQRDLKIFKECFW